MPVRLLDKTDSELSVEFLTFSGGERHIQLGKFGEAEHFIIRADLRTAQDVFDLLLLADALNAEYDAPQLYIEIPYLPYARQDRVCAPGQAFSLNVFARMLAQIDNVAELVIWDCHSPVGVELTGAKNTPAQDIIKSNTELMGLLNGLDAVIICPDKGAVKRTEAIATSLGVTEPLPVVYCEKLRDPATGHILRTEVKADDLSGKTAIITDDICDGGFTFIKIAEILKEKNVEQVILFVTHGILSKGLDVFDGLIDRVFTTTSFPHEPDTRLTVIPYAYPFQPA